MKEQIYAIPVLEAFRTETECPFCHLHQIIEQDAIAYMLGPAYMDDRIRMSTNDVGFCGAHYVQMYNEQNRLGLGLMIETHMQTVNSNLEQYANMVKPKKSGFSLSSIVRKNNNAEAMIEYLKKLNSSCYVCNKVNSDFERYIDTFFYLWARNPEIIELTKKCKGFCLEHFVILLESSQKLNATKQDEFLEIAVPLEIEHFKRVSEDVTWFVKKFDYRYAEEPWNNAKDALNRSILKISSKVAKD